MAAKLGTVGGYICLTLDLILLSIYNLSWSSTSSLFSSHHIGLEMLILTKWLLIIPYCYYYKRVLILANIGDLVITAKFCARY